MEPVTRCDFDERQWRKLVDAPRYAALGIVVVDFSYVSFAKEAWEMLGFVQSAKAMYRDEPLLQDVLAELTSLDSAEQPLARSLRDKSVEPAQLAELYLEEIAAAVDILKQRAPAEQDRRYRDFVYQFAERVAQASGEGLLGMGEKVSAKEAVFLRKLRACLDL